MRRKLLGLLMVAAFVVGLGSGLAGPVAAQNGEATIAQLVAGDEELETLAEVLEAAGLVETLDGDGPFTVFAPNDAAFEALPAGTLDNLLADEQALADMLGYHVVAGTLTAEVLAGLETVETLQGDSLAISVDEDGNIFLNDNVQIVRADVEATNGVIHVVDSVLQPPAAPSVDEEPDPGESGLTQVQVAHLAPDAPAIDVYLDGERALQGLAYGTLSDWLELPAGTYTLAVTAAGDPPEEAILGPTTLDLTTDTWYTLLVRGSLAVETLDLTVVSNTFRNVPDDGVAVTVIHAVADGPAITIENVGDSAPLVDGLAYPQDEETGVVSFTTQAGTYNLRIATADDDQTPLFTLENIRWATGNAYFIAVTGTLDDTDETDLAIVSSSATIVEDDETPDAPPPDDDTADEDTPDETLIGVAEEDRRFATLLLVLEQAGLTSTLRGGGPYTILAPSDRAFDGLPPGALDAVLADPTFLTAVLRYHVVEGELRAEDIAGMDSLTTLQGDTIQVQVDDEGNIILNGSVRVVEADLTAANGVLHVLDGVLSPE